MVVLSPLNSKHRDTFGPRHKSEGPGRGSSNSKIQPDYGSAVDELRYLIEPDISKFKREQYLMSFCADGGVWRGILVCNGETPCPTLFAEEGDIVELNVHNDLFAQISIHWAGMDHKK